MGAYSVLRALRKSITFMLINTPRTSSWQPRWNNRYMVVDRLFLLFWRPNIKVCWLHRWSKILKWYLRRPQCTVCRTMRQRTFRKSWPEYCYVLLSVTDLLIRHVIWSNHGRNVNIAKHWKRPLMNEFMWYEDWQRSSRTIDASVIWFNNEHISL